MYFIAKFNEPLAHRDSYFILDINKDARPEEVEAALCALFQKHYKRTADNIVGDCVEYTIISGFTTCLVTIIDADDFISV